MTEKDIYGLKTIKERAKINLKKSHISKKNKDTILKFIEHLEYIDIKEKRILKYLYTLPKIASSFNKDFETVTKDDIKKIVSKINNTERSEWTKHDYKVIIKRFYKWLLGNDEEYPTLVKDLFSRVDHNKLEEPDILTESEIKKMIKNSKYSRDRALIMILWESGARIEEILTLKLKDITPFQYGVKITIQKSKTDKRTLPLIQSAPYISNWINEHPNQDERENYLWTEINNSRPLKYDGVRMMLKRTAKKAKIKKRVYPHLFRHSRATFVANQGLTEFQMDKMFGWKLGSKVPSVYIQRSGINLEDPILKMNGIEKKTEEKEESKLKTKTCQICQEVNPATSNYCIRCFRPLNIKELQDEQDKALDLATENPHIVELLAKQMRGALKELLNSDPELIKKIIAEKENLKG